MTTKQFLSIFILFLTLFSYTIQSKTENVVSDFDLISYNPLKIGVQDIFCELRVEGLTERVKKEYVTVKVGEEIYYKIFWLRPNQFDIRVIGLPKGFLQLRNKLKALVLNRMDFLIPQDLSVKLKGYTLKKKEGFKGNYFEGVDPTNKLPVNRIEVGFDGRGVLSRYKSYSPLGFQDSNFTYAKKSWSKNRWVLEKVMAKGIQGPLVTEIRTSLEYDKFAGYGMPAKIEIKTTQRVSAPSENGKKSDREGKTILEFSNYKINMDEAGKHFRKKR